MVSNVGDMFGERLPQKFPTQPWVLPQAWPPFTAAPAISRQEFDALKAEVAEMKEMLKRAKAYDESVGQKGCEVEAKMDLLRKIAELVGISLDDVIGPRNPVPTSP